MRVKIVAGNWKMNKTIAEGKALVNEVLSLLQDVSLGEDKKVIFSPTSLSLGSICDLIGNQNNISVSSQNIYVGNVGAFTGEISAKMVADAGCEYTLVGHSERRSIFGESDALLANKVDAALSQNLAPIFCCGEQLDERKSNNHFSVVKSQIEKGLFHLNEDSFKKCVIAYEPVWAIGTGETASAEQAQEMHAFIRNVIKEKFGATIADNLTILYGGSCKPGNAKELFSCEDVDGGLIGGASLVAEDFVSIIKAL